MKSKDCSYRTNENRIIEGFEKSNESNLTKLSGKKDRETTMVLSERDQRFPMPRVLRIYFFPFCFFFSISFFSYFFFLFRYLRAFRIESISSHVKRDITYPWLTYS